MIKVMIADDQALIRESLQIILSAHQDIQVTSAVADGHEVIERIPQDRDPLSHLLQAVADLQLVKADPIILENHDIGIFHQKGNLHVVGMTVADRIGHGLLNHSKDGILHHDI